jgi:osmoprotectant transport system permease protein
MNRSVWGWLTSGGAEGTPALLAQHVELSAAAVAIAAVVAVPLGLWLGHRRRGAFAAITVANIGRALPSYAVLVLAVQWLGIGWKPVLVALVLLSVPPVLTNTYTGIAATPPELVDAARGMGMTGTQVLRQAELPGALGLIFAGLRTASVQCVATATLAALVAWGGLGHFIEQGLAANDTNELLAGVVAVVGLALLTEAFMGLLQRWASPAASAKRGKDVFLGPDLEVRT